MKQFWIAVANWVSSQWQRRRMGNVPVDWYGGKIIDPKVTSSKDLVIRSKKYQFTAEEVNSVVYQEPIINVRTPRIVVRGGGE